MSISIIATVVPQLENNDTDNFYFFVYLTPRISCSERQPLENFKFVYNWTDYSCLFNAANFQLSYADAEKPNEKTPSNYLYASENEDRSISITNDWKNEGSTEMIEDYNERKVWISALWHSMFTKDTPVDGWELDLTPFALAQTLQLADVNQAMNGIIETYKNKLHTQSLAELGVPGTFEDEESEIQMKDSLIAILNHLLTLSIDQKIASPYLNNASSVIRFPSFLTELNKKMKSLKDQRDQQNSDLLLKLSLAQVEDRNTQETTEFHKKMAAFGNFPFLLKRTGWILSCCVPKKEIPDGDLLFSFETKKPPEAKEGESQHCLACAESIKHCDAIDENTKREFFETINFVPASTRVTVAKRELNYWFKPQKKLSYLTIEDGYICDSEEYGTASNVLEKNQVFERINGYLEQKYQFDYNKNEAVDGPRNQTTISVIQNGAAPDQAKEIQVMNQEMIFQGKEASSTTVSDDYESTGVAVHLKQLKQAIENAVKQAPGSEGGNQTTDEQPNQAVEGTALIYGHHLHKGYRPDVYFARNAPAEKTAGTYRHGRSLCKRRVFYSLDFKELDKQKVTLPQKRWCVVDNDEGWVVESAQGSNSGKLYVDEELYRYNDWSLCTARLFRTNTDDNETSTDESVSAISNMKIFTRPQQGSLSTLRYGQSYTIIMRFVDICGGGRSLTDTVTNPKSNLIQQTPIPTYPRVQGVGAPLIFLGDPLLKHGNRNHDHDKRFTGEDVTTMVIRSTYDRVTKKLLDIPNERTRRFISPPKLDFHLVKKHGVFDVLMKAVAANPEDPEYAKISRKLLALTSLPKKPHFKNNIVDTSEEVVSTARDIDYLFDPLVNGYQVFINAAEEKPWKFSKKPDDFILDAASVTPYYQGVKYLEVVLEHFAGSTGDDYSIEESLNRQTISLQQGMEKLMEVSCNLVDQIELATDEWLRSDESGLQESSIYRQCLAVSDMLYNRKVPISRTKVKLIHAVQKPCLLYYSFKRSYFSDYYPATITTPDREKSQIPAQVNFNFEAFPCLTSESYFLHVCYIDKLPDKRATNDIGKPNSAGFRYVEVNRIIKTGLQPHKADIEQVVAFSGVEHTFSDSKFRQVCYFIEAVSKFKRFFDDQKSDFSIFGDSLAVADRETLLDGPRVAEGSDEWLASVQSKIRILNSCQTVRSCNAPPPLSVDRIVPLLKWDETTGERWCNAIRIYFEGDWYLTGDCESVSVFFIDDKKINSGNVPIELEQVMSQMGIDPASTTPRYPFPNLPVIDESFFKGNVTFLPSNRPGSPNTEALKVENLDFEGNQNVEHGKLRVKGAVYGIQYMPVDTDNPVGCYYIDIEIGHQDELKQLYFPFVRFAIARYQPNTIDNRKANHAGLDLKFSKVSVTDFVQLLPYRQAKGFNSTSNTISIAGDARASGKKTMVANELYVTTINTAGDMLRKPTPDDATIIIDLCDYDEQGSTEKKMEYSRPEAVEDTKVVVVEEYEHFEDDENVSDDERKHNDFRRRLIYSYVKTNKE